MVILTIDDIDCSYGSVNVLKDVNFAVNSGEFLGILGPNGSGKTTLLRSISRVLQPHKGTILIDDKDIYGMKSVDVAKQLA
jgi:iron complex transport system ATP-binding protein